MNIFVSGGCKNGKSYYAQKTAADMARSLGKPLYYVATMEPHDAEDHARIKRHVAERDGWGFTTLEQPVKLTELLERSDVDTEGVFLLDSVTALLGNEMFDDSGNTDISAKERVAGDLRKFAHSTGNTIFVSDNIYGDAEEYDETTELYRRSLAAADRALAECCDRVVEITFGLPEIWK